MEKSNLVDQLHNSFKEQNTQRASDFWNAMKDSASFRPTIFIGVGGFGCDTVRELKKSVEALIPDPQIRNGFGFIGIDTHNAEKGDILTTNEYVGVTAITPHVVAKQPDNKKYLDWYNKLPKGDWKARNITGGANQVRAVGRLAFLYPPTLNKFYSILSSTFNKVNAFRSNFQVASAPKVYLISSLAGGTGAGMYLDISIIITKYLMGATNGASLQTIIATADTLEGDVPAVRLPDLYTNTYGSLKDLYALASGKTTRVAYSIPGYESISADMNSIPNPIYLITGQNKDGKIVFGSFEELKFLAVSYLLFEIHTPLVKGGTKVQDQENEDLDTPGKGGMKKVFSSFGAIRFGIPSDEIKEYFSQIAVLKALDKELQENVSREDIETFINTQKLGEYGSDQLQDEIRKGKENKSISIALDLLAELQGVRTQDLVRTCKGILDAKIKLLKDNYSKIIADNAEALSNNVNLGLSEMLEELAQKRTLNSTVIFIDELNKNLKLHQQSLTEELNEGKNRLQKAKEKCQLSLGVIHNAAQSGYFGRKKRMELSITTFEADLQAELNQQIVVWSMEEGLKIYNSLISLLANLYSIWDEVKKKTLARKQLVTKSVHELIRKFERMADVNLREKGNRFSILSVNQINQLYKENIGTDKEENLSNEIRKNWKANKILKDLVTTDVIWYKNEVSRLLPEFEKTLKDMNIISVLKKFYSDDNKKYNLFENLMALGSPLYPLDNDFREPNYSEAWIIAVNPELKDEFLNILSGYIPADAGKSFATYPNKDEVIIYSLTHGFTPQSLSRMNHYFSHFSRNINNFKDRNNKTSRPYYARIESDQWEDLIPISKEEEEIRKWFALGRALSYLFPSKMKENGEPDCDKNEAFIYTKGSFYYLNMTIDHRQKKIKLGQGLQAAIFEFGENSEYKDYVQELVQNYISDKGIALVRKRLLEEYLPVLDSEMEKAQNSNDQERVEEMDHLRVAIRQYIDKELTASNV
jgi:hypothetical protein